MRERPVVYRAGPTFAAPFALLVAASIISWPWRALDLPGTIGNASPISLALLALTVLGGVWAMKARLPPRLFTWPPAGLGAVVFLSIGFGTQALEPEASPALVLGYAIVFAFVWVISLSLAKYGVSYAVGFACLFLMTQGIQVQVFEDAPVRLAGATALTAVSAIRVAVETGILVWLAYRLAVREDASPGHAALAMVGLLVVHAPVSAWEQLAGSEGGLTASRFFASAFLWLLFSGPLLAVVAVSARLWRSRGQEPAPERSDAAHGPAAAGGWSAAPQTASRSKRAAHRRRRARRSR